jgi:hypothetical protein
MQWHGLYLMTDHPATIKSRYPDRNHPGHSREQIHQQRTYDHPSGNSLSLRPYPPNPSPQIREPKSLSIVATCNFEAGEAVEAAGVPFRLIIVHLTFFFLPSGELVHGRSILKRCCRPIFFTGVHLGHSEAAGCLDLFECELSSFEERRIFAADPSHSNDRHAE